MRWLDGIADSEHELEQTPEDSEAQETWHAAIHGVKRAGLQRKMGTEELMFLNCGVGEDSCESLYCKEIQPVYPKGDKS